MADMTLGLIHPGEMGASIGAAARAGGTRVLWASKGRSAATKRRAADAGLVDAGTSRHLVGSCDVILSVCPPGAALTVAESVAGLGFDGVYVDANAVAPATAREIAQIVGQAGARFVDGGIIGPPSSEPGTTRLYLAGEDAALVAAFFRDTALEAIPLSGDAGAASALKMAYAGYTKGTAALLMLVRALARYEEVEEALVREWDRSLPGLPMRSERAALGTAPKAWRFAGEMEEIAATLEDAGLPGGFHHAAAQLYQRLEGFKEPCEPLNLDLILAHILDSGPALDSSD